MAVYGFDENKDKVEVVVPTDLTTRTIHFDWLSHDFESRLNAIWTLHNKLKSGEACTCMTNIAGTRVFITGGKYSSTRGSYIYSSVLSTSIVSARIYSTTDKSVAFSEISAGLDMTEIGGQIETI